MYVIRYNNVSNTSKRKRRGYDDEGKSASEGGWTRERDGRNNDFRRSISALSRVKLPRAGSFMPRLPLVRYFDVRFVIELLSSDRSIAKFHTSILLLHPVLRRVTRSGVRPSSRSINRYEIDIPDGYITIRSLGGSVTREFSSSGINWRCGLHAKFDSFKAAMSCLVISACLRQRDLLAVRAVTWFDCSRYFDHYRT